MRLLPRLVVFYGLAYLGIILVLQGKRLAGENATDPSQLLIVLGGAVLVAVLAGVLVALTFLPMLGDALARLLYGETELPREDPLLLARERVEEGEFQEAQSLYRQALAGKPDDAVALSELADLQAGELEEPAAAAGLLERALEKEWPEDERIFLRCKLAEVYSQQPENVGRARTLLLQVISENPQAANSEGARNLLRELDH